MSLTDMLFFNIIITLLLVLVSVSSATEQMKETGTFSSLNYHKEADDLLGYEIRIVLTRNGYEGTFQSAEGGSDGLILLKYIIIQDDKVEFTIPNESNFEGKFVGKVSTNYLSGVLTLVNGNKILIKLKRGKSYWD